MQYRFGDYELDPEGYTLRKTGEPISVEPRVFDLLAYLIEHRERVVPKEELVQEVWSGAFITDAALKRAVVEARRAIGDDGRHQVAIQTVYGRGYRFVGEVAEEPAPPTRSPRGVRRWLIGLASLGAAVLVAVAAVFLPGWWPVRERPEAAPAPLDRIAVFPFSVRGGEELAYLGEGMVDLLSSNLDGAAELRTIDPRAVVRAAAHAGKDLSDPVAAGRVAERLGAGLYVLGDIVEAGGRLRISGRLYGARQEGEGTVLASVEGTAAQLFELVDALTAQLLAVWPEGPGGRVARLAATTTESVPALKAYLEGERLFRGGRRREAIEALQRATQIDNTFALAYYRLATAYRWPTQQELAMEALERAMPHSSRVGDRTRQLIQAFDASLHKRHAEAERSYRQIVTHYPDDVEAWAQLGWLILVRGMFLGRSWTEAREAFEWALSLDPRHYPSLRALTNIAARERRRTALELLTDRLLELQPGQSKEWEARGQRAIVLGDADGVQRFVAKLQRSSDLEAWGAAGYVTWTTGDLVTGRQLWRLIADPARSPGVRAMAYMTLAKLEVTGGRWRAAQGELDALEALDYAAGLEHRVYFALARFLPVDQAELEVLQEELLEWDATQTSSAATSGLVGLHAPVHPYLRLYLLGLLSNRLGNDRASLGYAEQLERLGPSSPFPHFVADLARSVRMEAAWLSGRREEALTILEGANFWRFVELDPDDSPFLSHAYERLARAELLYELGRWDEALRWHQAMADKLVYGGGVSHLRLGELYERRRDSEEAARHYQRFIELWQDCDPELRSRVEEAVERLAGLPVDRDEAAAAEGG